MDKRLAQLGEFGLIDLIRRWAGKPKRAHLGIGDDAALIPAGKNKFLCFSTDTITEQVHFLKTDPAEKIGWKALAVNISDFAAMGARPEYALVSLTVPRRATVWLLHQLYSGLLRCARAYKVDIVGGDTVSGKALSLTVSALGTAMRSQVVLRRGARPGDFIYVTGRLGGSIYGRHLTFKPRLQESLFLVRHFRPHAMMDVSDGLLQDLGHVLAVSGVGAEVALEAIPVDPVLFKKGKCRLDEAVRRASMDGEDFELLFTLAPSLAGKLERAWRRMFKTKLTRIGKIVKAPKKLQLFRQGTCIRSGAPQTFKGYTHF